MKQAMNRFCALIYGADDGLGGLGGIEELALLQLERLLELRSSLPGADLEYPVAPKQEF